MLTEHPTYKDKVQQRLEAYVCLLFLTQMFKEIIVKLLNYKIK